MQGKLHQYLAVHWVTPAAQLSEETVPFLYKEQHALEEHFDNSPTLLHHRVPLVEASHHNPLLPVASQSLIGDSAHAAADTAHHENIETSKFPQLQRIKTKHCSSPNRQEQLQNKKGKQGPRFTASCRGRWGHSCSLFRSSRSFFQRSCRAFHVRLTQRVSR